MYDSIILRVSYNITDIRLITYKLYYYIECRILNYYIGTTIYAVQEFTYVPTFFYRVGTLGSFIIPMYLFFTVY